MDGMTEGLTDIRTYVRTHPLIEMQGRIKKKKFKERKHTPFDGNAELHIDIFGWEIRSIIGCGGEKNCKTLKCHEKVKFNTFK